MSKQTVAEELGISERHKDLWDRAWVQTDGDEERARLVYARLLDEQIEARAQQAAKQARHQQSEYLRTLRALDQEARRSLLFAVASSVIAMGIVLLGVVVSSSEGEIAWLLGCLLVAAPFAILGAKTWHLYEDKETAVHDFRRSRA